VRLLGGLTVERFLAEHWQKAPLLVRGALPGVVAPLSPDELAGLACEDEVESRIVTRSADPQRPFALRHGPFGEADFAALPARDWTLLVQDCDKQAPSTAAFLDPFRFIPDWRIDDLMISYATAGGGVGPHVDQYDVFLVQVLGRRRWRIAPGRPDARSIPGLELAVLAEFEPEQEWVLEPGDLLYLPPGVAHDGVALDDCMTCSVGFRAPSLRELHSDLAELLHETIPAEARFADPWLRAEHARPRGRIDPEALAAVRSAARKHLHPSDDELDLWFARFVTEPKPGLRPELPEQPLDPETLAEELRAGGRLVRDPRALLAWVELASGGLVLAADGVAHPLPATLRPLVELLCASPECPPQALGRYLGDPLARALLAALLNQGTLELETR
jgi:50S ribosomal protein L16 3-hydroxylase